MKVCCTLLRINAKKAGRLLGLADVELDFDGIVVERYPPKGSRDQTYEHVNPA
jgi:hypothetical protein